MTTPKESSAKILTDEYVVLTTDEWTSIATDVPVAVPAHYRGLPDGRF